MVRNAHKKFLLKCLTVVMAIAILGCLPINKAGALSEGLQRRYSDYQIYFYNAEQCEAGTTIPGGGGDGPDPDPGWEQWDGSCTAMTAQRINWIRGQISDMQAVASSNGLPWELIAAQAIMESGGGSSEVCPFNPLGLKGAGPSCDGRHRSFNSYKEAYQHYVNSIIPIKATKHKYPNNPYAAIAYVQYGTGSPYAQCSRPEYLINPNHACFGHKLGDPTPGYVNRTSSIICGLQKWAKSQGIAISSVTWENYKGSGGGSGGGTGGGTGGSEGPESGAIYCGPNGATDPGEDEPGDEEGLNGLKDYVLKWAWPDYHKAPYLQKMPAYAAYMNQSGIYKGGCSGIDCGAFVANIIKASGWDTSYPQASTSVQGPWLASHWNKVSVDSLKLGDVGYRTGHVILYVGSISGFNSKTASASQCERAPMAGSPNENLNRYTWYRKR